MRAKGIDAGTKIDLFSNVEVTFAGISPDAYALVTNKWGDEYLGSLIFTADMTENIQKGDAVTIRCETGKEELGRHGYITDTLEVTVRRSSSPSCGT